MSDQQYQLFLQQTALVWDWPIAIYLFLLGISVGMVAITMLLQWQNFGRPVNQAIIYTTAIFAPAAVVSGLLILVFHLSKPWTFWLLMIFYSPTSVMSIGVILFQLYMLVLLCWLWLLFRQPIRTYLGKRLLWLERFNPATQWVEKSLFVLAILLGAYTGFLLSALKTYPMLNNPVLPILFLFSGLSSGVAAISLLSVALFKYSNHSKELCYLHKIETPIVYSELFLLFCLFIGLFLGGGQKTIAATTALFSSAWALIFWLGIIGAGILLPLFFRYFASPQRQQHPSTIIALSAISLFGILLLRIYILYAGQLTLA